MSNLIVPPPGSQSTPPTSDSSATLRQDGKVPVDQVGSAFAPAVVDQVEPAGLTSSSRPGPTTSTAAPLPNVAGAPPSGESRIAAGNAVQDWLKLGKFNLAEVLKNLVQQGSDDAQFKGIIRRSGATAAYQLSVESSHQVQAEVAAERGAAGVNFAGQAAGAVIAGAAAYKGTAWSLQADKAAAGAATVASGSAISGLISSGVTGLDKVSGYQYDADNAKINQKVLETQLSVAKARDDDFAAHERQSFQNLDKYVELAKDVYASNNAAQRAIIGNT